MDGAVGALFSINYTGAEPILANFPQFRFVKQFQPVSCVCLLIDDDLDDQEIFGLAVQELGMNVLVMTARDGVEGLALLRSEDSAIPDFIFVDLNMPRMNGRDVIKALPGIGRIRKAKTILYSTSADNADLKQEMYAAGVQVIVKPPSLAGLVVALFAIFKTNNQCE